MMLSVDWPSSSNDFQNFETKLPNFEIELLNNRKVTGLTSGASAIIELAGKRIITDTFNLGLPVELLINNNSLDGSFLNGETVTIPINDEINNLSENFVHFTIDIIANQLVTDEGLNSQTQQNLKQNAFKPINTINPDLITLSGLLYL
jgi:hypothetical protein